jgi:hypothetical protein
VTKQEHQLILSLMAGQFQLTMSLFEMMNRSNVADDSDLQPFVDYVAAAVPKFRDTYLQIAEQFGLRPSV